MSPLPPLRRTALAAGCVLALTSTGLVPAAAAEGDRLDLTLLATTDVHGHIDNWDYFRAAEYAPGSSLGLARAKTVVDEVRAREGAESVVVVDNGDAIQGTPLTYFYGMREPVTETDVEHPMATAFDHLGLDAQTVGNHEFNYGLDLLDAYDADLDAPLLGANVVDATSGEPALDPYTLVERTIDGTPVTVGIIGLVTPGVRVWDRNIVEGELEFEDMVETAQKYVPEVAAKADVVVVLAHTGQGPTPSSEYDPAALTENAVLNIAEMVPGIDVVVAGHTHQDKPSTLVTNRDGQKVLITQPFFWARSVSEVTLPLVEGADGAIDVDWTGTGPTVTPHYSKDVADSPSMLEATRTARETAREYVASPVATSVREMSTATARYEDTPIIDFIAHVQQETVREALVGTQYADLPVLTQASPFSRDAVFPKGQVAVRDMAALYIYENTLGASLLTGAQVKDYLEHSATYYNQVPAGEAFDPDRHTNATTPANPNGIPDYALDQLTGVNYRIDLNQPAGSRILDLTYPDGSPVGAQDEVVLAVNNYRQSGGSGYPHIAGAPVVYNEQQEIRQLLIDWATEHEVIDEKDFYARNWSIVQVPGATTPPADTIPTIHFAPGFTGGPALETLPVASRGDVLAGDFTGAGTDQIAYREGNVFVFPAGAGTTTGEVRMAFGEPSDVPVVGDWNGDGVDTIAVRRGNTFHVTNGFTGGEAETSVAFGKPSDVPVAADWNGIADGTTADSIAVVRDNVWYFSQENTAVTASSRAYGRAGDVPLVGDWDGDGRDTPGVRRATTFLLTNTDAPTAQIEFAFGTRADHPFVIDRDGKGDRIAVLRH